MTEQPPTQEQKVLRDQFFAPIENASLECLEEYGKYFAWTQRGVNWWLGDLARYAERRWPDTWHQVFPEWISPGLVARCKAVAEAYPREEDRNIDATWSIHRDEKNRPDRIARVQAHVDAGRTSDEAKEANTQWCQSKRWLLCVDVSYFINKYYHSGLGVESAMRLSEWIESTAKRLKADGLTDVACCFDSRHNYRRELTKDWEDGYKDRPEKPHELQEQLKLVYKLLNGLGFCCAGVKGFEADDVMASFAKQFPGRVTLLTPDKDCRQCLSEKCDMLVDVEWDGESRQHVDKWLTVESHLEHTGVPPEKWAGYQALWGDPTDNVKGAKDIGAVIARELILTFGDVYSVLEAAKSGDERIPEKKRLSLLAFAPKLATTLKLVTLSTKLDLPSNTRI